ncbi:MAG: hypothetical protein V3W11_06310 [bacterium]
MATNGTNGDTHMFDWEKRADICSPKDLTPLFRTQRELVEYYDKSLEDLYVRGEGIIGVKQGMWDESWSDDKLIAAEVEKEFVSEFREGELLFYVEQLRWMLRKEQLEHQWDVLQLRRVYEGKLSEAYSSFPAVAAGAVTNVIGLVASGMGPWGIVPVLVGELLNLYGSAKSEEHKDKSLEALYELEKLDPFIEEQEEYYEENMKYLHTPVGEERRDKAMIRSLGGGSKKTGAGLTFSEASGYVGAPLLRRLRAGESAETGFWSAQGAGASGISQNFGASSIVINQTPVDQEAVMRALDTRVKDEVPAEQ